MLSPTWAKFLFASIGLAGTGGVLAGAIMSHASVKSVTSEPKKEETCADRLKKNREKGNGNFMWCVRAEGDKIRY